MFNSIIIIGGESINYKKIGEFIFQLRKEKDMTQRELADKLHITEQAVSKWERGLGCPDISLFKPLSKLLDVSVNELMNGEKINDENIKEQADNAILNALSHSQKIISKMNKQIILIIVGVLLVIYGYNTYGIYNDYSTLFGFTFFPYRRIIIILGIIGGIVGIIIGLMTSKKKKTFLSIMACILLILTFLNIYCFYNYNGSMFGTIINVSNLIRLVMIILGVSTTIIGIMFERKKIKILLTILITTILLFSGTYIVDLISYNKIKLNIVSRHYDYSEILKKAAEIRNDKNENVVDDVIKGIEDLKKQQKYVDKLNNKKISLTKGDMFIYNYTAFYDLGYIGQAYDKYEKDNDASYRGFPYTLITSDSEEISKDLYYALYSSSANQGFYKYCTASLKESESSLFPKNDDTWGYGACDFPFQLFYELEHENDLRIFEEILDNVRQ